MKAYVLKGIADLQYCDVDMPELLPSHALVKVKACGICSSDIPRIFKKGTYHFPTIPGHEFSGVVVAVGSDEYTNLLNKYVAVFPLIPCKKCKACLNKQYELCENYNYLGSRCDGGFAEYVSVPVWNLVELNDRISFCAGAMFEPFAVALHCVRQSDVKSGQTVGIVGSGTIAFAVGQWIKYFGAEAYIIGKSAAKKAIADKLNIHYLRTEELQSMKFDVTIEAVGSSEALSTAIEHVSSSGTVVVMGNPSGDICLSQNVYWQLLRRQIHLIGTWNSSFDGTNQSEWTTVRDALGNGSIFAEPLITHTFRQEDLPSGLSIMRDHTQSFCKVMTLWNEE